MYIILRKSCDKRIIGSVWKASDYLHLHGVVTNIQYKLYFLENNSARPHSTKDGFMGWINAYQLIFFFSLAETSSKNSLSIIHEG